MKMDIVDLRSDTVTLPTPEMLEAMANAELGDDVFGEDPTTNRLEEMAARRMGKEAAMLVCSGTMGNLVSILTHCGRGAEVILGDQSHTFCYEVGGISALGGIHPRCMANQADGTLRLCDIESAIRGDNIHFPRTQLICVENTHNRCCGAVLSVEYMEAVGALAAKRGLRLHVDGARIFNAAVALGVDVKELVRGADSVSFCLSKGLSAPVGSVVCGSREFISEARRNRKMVGGGMRQCGIIAAAGIVAMEKMVDRLGEDHANARKLAEGLGEIDGLVVETGGGTNMVYFRSASTAVSADRLIGASGAEGVRFLEIGPNRFRMVTHYGIDAKDIVRTIEVMRRIVAG
jgi:threonine aldolase